MGNFFGKNRGIDWALFSIFPSNQWGQSIRKRPISLRPFLIYLKRDGPQPSTPKYWGEGRRSDFLGLLLFLGRRPFKKICARKLRIPERGNWIRRRPSWKLILCDWCEWNGQIWGQPFPSFCLLPKKYSCKLIFEHFKRENGLT